MNRSLQAVVIAAILIVFSSQAAALDLTGVPVSLAAAMDLALKVRPEQRLAVAKEQIARSKVEEARGNYLPTLDLSTTTSYINNYDTFTGIDISAEISGQMVDVSVEKEVPAYEVKGAIDLVYNLYAGGRDSALLSEAQYHLEATGHEGEITRRKIRLEVANAYWELKKAQVKYLMAKRELEVVRLQMQVEETKHRVDRASVLDREAVLLKSTEKQVALRAADRQCLRAFDNYRYVLGLRKDVAVQSCEQLPTLVDVPGLQTGSDEQPLVHPEILHLKNDIQAAAEKQKAAKAENRPKLDFFAKYAMAGRDPDTYPDAWQDAQSEYYKVGLEISMNLFNGFRTRERIRQAEAEQRTKRLELMQKERALAEERRDRQAALQTAQDQLDLALARKKLEEARQQSAATGLGSGRISRLEYRQRTVDAQNADDDVIIAQIDVAMAQKALALMVSE